MQFKTNLSIFLRILSSLMRQSGNCLLTPIIKNPFTTCRSFSADNFFPTVGGSVWRIFEYIRIFWPNIWYSNTNIDFFISRIYSNIHKNLTNILNGILLSWRWINALNHSDYYEMGPFFWQLCDRYWIVSSFCHHTRYFAFL